ncbi:MAG: hypothetical protein AUH31_01185 [Armatimonadetes bacterium 13_1_40CM_64_14]|nr:MAG: hypothetical protein AUH31_01185 [Armatimonadetes bacterium 13_1_40CM_64_14]
MKSPPAAEGRECAEPSGVDAAPLDADDLEIAEAMEVRGDSHFQLQVDVWVRHKGATMAQTFDRA